MLRSFTPMSLVAFLVCSQILASCFIVGFPLVLQHQRPISSLFLEHSSSSAFRELDAIVNTAPTKDLLDLRTAGTGAYRGVHVRQDVATGDILLRIDLNEHCICDDDFLPDWCSTATAAAPTENNTKQQQQWVVRLAAILLDAYLSPEKHKVQQLWFSLLPDAQQLRSSLPIHWSEEAVRSTLCRPLEMAVDSMFFTRQHAVEALWTALREARPQQPLNVQWLDDILDLVQTRVCQLQPQTSDGTSTTTLRCFAPVFDCINHHPLQANAAFGVDDSTKYLMVTAKRDIRANEEVFIHYGSTSTQPAWKCLLSYGFFVPGPDEEDLVPIDDDGSYAVGRTGVPPELLGDPPTPEMAQKLCTKLQQVFDTLTETSSAASPDNHPAMRLAVALKQHHRDILRACIDNLREWAAENEVSSNNQEEGSSLAS